MTTVLGIVMLGVCAIGAMSVLSWIYREMVKLHRSQWGALPLANLFKPNGTGTLLKVSRTEEMWGEKLTRWEDLPQYKGRTMHFGLPHYRDAKVPDKHNYATVEYMDHPIKQYVYDVMTNFSGGLDAKGIAYQLFFPVMFILAGAPVVTVLVLSCLFYAWSLLWLTPAANRASRRSAERCRNLKPNDWRKIYQEIAEEKAQEDMLVRALRRSGIRRL